MPDSSESRGVARQWWRRYRLPLLTALPLGFVVGALAGLAFWLNSLELGIGPSLGVMLLQYGCIGAAFAAAALLGASLAVVTQTGPREHDATPFARIGIGAATTIAAGVLTAGAFSAAATDSWGWYWLTCWIAIITALIGGATTASLTALFQYKDRILP